MKQTNKQVNNQTTLIIFWSSDDHLMIICLSFDDYLMIIWNKQTKKQTNWLKPNQITLIIFWPSAHHLMIIYSLTNKYRFSSGDHMFIVWSNIQTYKKQTNNENKQSLSCSDHQLIIWWSSVNHLEINKQTKHIIWWSSGYHYMIIAYLITNKQTNKQTNKCNQMGII